MKQTWTENDIRLVLKMFMDAEKGKAVSELDRAYKRGWRDCIRGLREHIKVKFGTGGGGDEPT